MSAVMWATTFVALPDHDAGGLTLVGLPLVMVIVGVPLALLTWALLLGSAALTRRRDDPGPTRRGTRQDGSDGNRALTAS